MPNNESWEEAKEVASNWFKFVNVGDKIKGTLLKKSEQKSNDPAMPDQWVYELKTNSGAVYNVGVSVNKPGTIQRLNNCQIGEVIGIMYEKDGEVKKKGFAPAKYLKVVTFGMDEEYRGFEDADEPALPDV